MIVYIPFLTVALLIILTPGPDIALLARSALVGGRKQALITSAGITSGVLVWAIASSLGLAAILEESAVAYTAVRIAGAAYLVYLGIRIIISLRNSEKQDIGIPPNRISLIGRINSPFARGTLNNLLNPKMGVLFVSLIPQFVTPGPGFAWEVIELAVIFDLMGLCWLLLLSHLLGTGRNIFRSARVRRTMDAVTGSVLTGLGIAVAVEGA